MLFTKTGAYPTGTNRYTLEAEGNSQAEALKKLKTTAEEKAFTLISYRVDPKTRMESLVGSTPRYTTYYASVGEGYFTSPATETQALNGKLIYDPPAAQAPAKGEGWLR